jgi:23S rRNA (uracil1939-C5)-methyltransferase
MVRGTGVNPIVSNFEVRVEKLVYGGDGLARLDGRVVFAPFVLPGERIRATARARSRAWCRRARWKCWRPRRSGWPPAARSSAAAADATTSTRRTNTRCEAKRAILVEELRRLGKIEPPAEIAVVTGPRGDIATARSCTSRAEDRLSRAALAQPVLDRRLSHLRRPRLTRPSPPQPDGAGSRAGRCSWKPSRCSATKTRADQRLDTRRPVARRFFEWCGERIPGLVEGALDYGGRFRVSSNSFFQVNRFLADRLVETALDGAEGETALDLYAGVGLFRCRWRGAFGA